MREPTKQQAREEWIKRYTGYFGEPIYLNLYRLGEITFKELRDRSIKTANDMVTEAGRCNYAALKDES